MTMLPFITPMWSVPAQIRAYTTTRTGGYSQNPFNSLNLAQHVGDDPLSVHRNRAWLCTQLKLPHEPRWVTQVHGIQVIDATMINPQTTADAVFTHTAGQVCAILTADCLPVFFCNRAGTQIALAHAGWRGLLNGVLENTVQTFTDSPANIIAWIGVGIHQAAFEVGDEVRTAFLTHDKAAISAFLPAKTGYWWCDLYQLAQQRLSASGLQEIGISPDCSYQNPQFFSYRRDKITGRMASLIWIAAH